MDSGSRVKKKLSRVGKGVPNIYFEFPFGAKLAFGKTNGIVEEKS